MARRRSNPVTAHLRGREKATGARRGQGTILTWDAVTLENTVDFRGRTHTNMPLLTVTNAVDYIAGDIVIIEGWAPDGKLSSWYILGKVIKPPIAPPPP